MRFTNTCFSYLLMVAMFFTTVIPSNVKAERFDDYTAEASTPNEKIAQVFDQFKYEMTVEWDQKDPYFKEYAQKEFENSLSDLRAQGITELELLQYVEQNILDAKTRRDYQMLRNYGTK